MDTIGVGDLLAVMNGKEKNEMGGSWMWVIFLFFIFAIFFSGGSFFGRGNDTPASSAFTSQEFQLAQLDNGIRSLGNGLCDGFYGQNTTMLQGFNTIGSEIANNRFAAQECCCETNRNIDAVRYEAAKNTCDIITAGNTNTQAILSYLTNEKIESLRDQLQSANLTLANQVLANQIVNQIRPVPIPAYQTRSPFTSLTGCSCLA